MIDYFLEMIPHLKVDRLTELANQFSFGTPLIASTPQLRCFAYIVTPENGSIIAHVNNIGAYFELNKAVSDFHFKLSYLKQYFFENFADIQS